MPNSTTTSTSSCPTSRTGRRPANFGKRYPAETLTRDEVRRLMAACSRRAPTGIRNRAAIAVLYRAGLRVSELLNLKIKDLDREAGTLRILGAKGGKSRTVGVDAGAVALVEAWLEVRVRRNIKKSAPLVCTLAGGQVSAEYMRQMLRRMAARAGIERRIHPHAFRHTFAVELVSEKQADGSSIPLPHIQRLLGHSSLATTATYLQGLRPQAAIDAIRSRPAWRDDAQG